MCGVGELNSKRGSDQVGAQYGRIITGYEAPTAFGSVATTYGEGDYTGITSYSTKGLQYGKYTSTDYFFYSPVTQNEDYWGFAGGADGTAEHPYIITSTEGLDMLSEQVKGGDGYQGEYFELSDDITYTYSGTNPDNYTAIGYYSTYYYSQPFKGHFDGKGHTVSGIPIYKATSPYQGLFGYVTKSSAEVKNVTLDDAIIVSYGYSAGVVGHLEYATVSNCHVTASVTLDKINIWNPSFHGGFIGVARGSSYAIRFTDCLFDGQLLMMTKKAENCGGFVGWHEGYIYFTGCYFNPFSVTLSTYQSATFSRNGLSKIEHSYYKTTYGTAQGIDASGMTDEQLLAADALGSGWEISGGNVVPKMFFNIVNPVFEDVTIDKTAPAPVAFNGGSFNGGYAPLPITDANRNSILLLSSSNRLGYAKTDRTLGAFRAYFEVPATASVRSFVLNFFDEQSGKAERSDEAETTTGIITITNFTNDSNSGAWYMLDDRRLSGKPTKNGLYIVNGRKVVVK